MHLSSCSYPIDTRAPDLRWGKMCDVLDLGVRRRFRFRTAVQVACTRMPLVSITQGQFVIVCLFINGVLTLVYFWFAPVLAMPQFYRLVCGQTLHEFLVLLKFSKLISLCVTLILIVLEPSHQSSYVRPEVITNILVVAVALDLWSYFLTLNCDMTWFPAPWIQQYVVIHKVGW